VDFLRLREIDDSGFVDRIVLGKHSTIAAGDDDLEVRFESAQPSGSVGGANQGAVSPARVTGRGAAGG
jgi:hypothetical protein